MWNRIDVGGRSAVIRLSNGKRYGSMHNRHVSILSLRRAWFDATSHGIRDTDLSDTAWSSGELRCVAGTLWTQSPVELTPDLRQAYDELGEVKHIVSPNYEHISFGKQVGSHHGHLYISSGGNVTV